MNKGPSGALSMLLALCPGALGLNPSLDINQYAHTAWTIREGFFKGTIYSIAQTPDGYLWLGTEFGLLRFDGNRSMPWQATPFTGRWRTTVIRFGCTRPAALVRIARSELDAWIADPKRTVHTTVWDAADGVRLRSTAPSGYGPRVAKSTDGKLWFVTGDGVQIIDPRYLSFNKLAPQIHIERVTADHKIRWRNLWSETPSNLRLPKLSRDLEIDYTALSLVAPEKIRFRYKLEGYDGDWQDAGNRRQAFYTNLSPTNYRFRVMASNNSGVSNETGTALDFSVAPAYYQTTWVRILCGTVFLTMIWAIHRLRVRILEERHAISERHRGEIRALNECLMKAHEEERIRTAGELHDGILQQITSFTLRLGTATLKLPADSEAKTRIKGLQKELIQMGTEIRQLSHELHPAVLQEAGLTAALRSYCEEFSKIRGIPVSCEVDESVPWSRTLPLSHRPGSTRKRGEALETPRRLKFS
jgi:hypothetical protein